MGIRISRSTWSSPLQLIDSWLTPARQDVTALPRLSSVASRFVKAGWLQRRASNDAQVHAPSSAAVRPHADATAPKTQLRVAGHAQGSTTGDGRVRLSGRLIDVCAELERLAAMDSMQVRRHG